MDPITIGSLALSGASLVSRFFRKSEAQKREEQRREHEASVNRVVAYLTELKREGIGDVARKGQAVLASSRSAAMQRAAAKGRSTEAESYMLPVEAQGATAANQAVSNYVTEADRPIAQARLAGLSADLKQPYYEDFDWGDYAGELGGAGLRYGLLHRTESVEDAVPTTPKPAETYGVGPSEADLTSPPEEGAFRMDETPGVDLSQSYMTEPSLVAGSPQSLQYNPRLRAYRGLRRPSLFGG